MEKLEVAMKVLQSYCCDNKAVKCKEEDFLTIRSSIQKLNALLSNGEQRRRFCTNESYLHTIIYALLFLADRLTRLLVVRLLFRLLLKSGYKKHAPSLVQKGLTRALFQTLYLESAESTPNEEFMIRIHQLLCRLGHFDRRFGVRARVSQCLPITLGLLRAQVALLGTCTSVPSYTVSGINSGLANSATGCSSATQSTGGSSNSSTTGCHGSFVPSSGNITSGGIASTSTVQATGLSANTYHGSLTGTALSIPSSLSRNLSTILRTLRLYVVSGGGRSNSSILGRTGAILLLIRLLGIVTGLPTPKMYPGRLSPSVSANKSSTNITGSSCPSVSTNAGYNGSANSVASNTNTCILSSGCSVNNNGYGAAVGFSGFGINSSSLAFSRTNHENGLVIGSPVVTAITATASASAALQRHRIQILTSSNKGTGHQRSSMSFLASSAASLLSTPPSPLAPGVRYHSKLLRLILNTLHCLIRWRHNAGRAIDAGGLSVLLDLFLDVHRCDLHGRRISLQRSSLACLRCVTSSRIGRKLFISCGGLHTFFAICAGYVGPDPLDRAGLNLIYSAHNSTTEASSSCCRTAKHGPSVIHHGGIHTLSHTTAQHTEFKTVQYVSTSVENEMRPTKPIAFTIQEPATVVSQATSIFSVTTTNSTFSVSASTLCARSSAVSSPLMLTRSEVGSGAGDSACSDFPRRGVRRFDKSTNLVAILGEACMLLRRCCPRSRLPVTSAEGILRCPLPRDRNIRAPKDVPVRPEHSQATTGDRQMVQDSMTNEDKSQTTDDFVTSCKKEDKRLRSKDMSEKCPRAIQLIAYGDRIDPSSFCESTILPNRIKETESTRVREVKQRPVTRRLMADPVHPLVGIQKPKSRWNNPRWRRARRSKPNAHNQIKIPAHLNSSLSVGCSKGSSTSASSDLSVDLKNSSNTPAMDQYVRHRPRQILAGVNSRKRSSGHCTRSSARVKPDTGNCDSNLTVDLKSQSAATNLNSVFVATQEILRRLRTIRPDRADVLSRLGSPRFRDSPPSPVSLTAELNSKLDLSDEEQSECDSSTTMNQHFSTHIRSSSAIFVDADDDDGDDDFDEDEDDGVVQHVASPPMDPQVILNELLKSHGRFFPEWTMNTEQENMSATSDSCAPWFHDDTTSKRQTDPTKCKNFRGALETDLNTVDSLSSYIRYLEHARCTQSLVPFQIVAYPDLVCAPGAPYIERFYDHNDTSNKTNIESTSPLLVSRSTGGLIGRDVSDGTESTILQPTATSNLKDRPDFVYLPVPAVDVGLNSQAKFPSERCTSIGNRCSPGYVIQPCTTISNKRVSRSTGNLQNFPIEKPMPRLPYSLHGLQHIQILDDVRRLVDSEDVLNRTVFDLDELLLTAMREAQPDLQHISRPNSPRPSHSPNLNIPGKPVTVSTIDTDKANFSFFESEEANNVNTATRIAHRTSPVSSSQPGSWDALRPLRTNNYLSSCLSSKQVARSVCVCAPEVGCEGFGDCVITNEDEVFVNCFDADKGHLDFESRFECGNLRKAVQVCIRQL
ncbi:hypothetical protein PHET_04467 [Paragonimus heterotremus]|uniref:Uncharacterized protein n=1 Tax=Paragonimus heterotremus TaxID=100268 RepID=A0A8J4TBJ6_9TREM|nr:hypothetical protein PHET_04467 [Paragonimus heterotremus]